MSAPTMWPDGWRDRAVWKANRGATHPRTEIETVLAHAAGMERFTPKSLEFFCGMAEDKARAHCVALAKLGKLVQETRNGELWYRVQL